VEEGGSDGLERPFWTGPIPGGREWNCNGAESSQSEGGG